MSQPTDAERFKASFTGIWDGWLELNARMLKTEEKEKEQHKKPPSRYNGRFRTRGKGYTVDTTLAIDNRSAPQRDKPMVTYQTGVCEADADGTQNVWPRQG